MTLSPHWTVAIFASREKVGVLQKTVEAAIIACADVPSTVDILVNGTLALANEASVFLGTLLQKPTTCTVRLWYITGADKSHTWNQFLYQIASPDELTFFIDGYVRLKPDALGLLAQGLKVNPDALAGTGVPTVGRTAEALKKTMLTTGGMHGNLYCIRQNALRGMKALGFKLPIGLYRNDSLLGAIFNYNLDPARYKWMPDRIFVHPTATWDLSTHTPSAWSQMSTMWKRKIRQCQGTLENIALRDHLSLRRRPPHELSSSIAQIIISWVNHNRFEAFKIFCGSPVTYYVYSRLNRLRPLPGLDIAPQLISSNSCASVPSMLSIRQSDIK